MFSNWILELDTGSEGLLINQSVYDASSILEEADERIRVEIGLYATFFMEFSDKFKSTLMLVIKFSKFVFNGGF